MSDFVIQRGFDDVVATDAMAAWLETAASSKRANPDPLSISCPRCKAPRGRPCRSTTGATTQTCKARNVRR